MDSNSNPDPLQGSTEHGALDKLDVDKLHDRLGGQLSTYVDLKVGAVEAKLGGQMTGLEREVSAKLDAKPSHTSLTGHTIAIIVAVLAVLAFGGERFSGGMSATGALAEREMQRERREAELDNKIDTLAQELAQLRQAQENREQE